MMIDVPKPQSKSKVNMKMVMGYKKINKTNIILAIYRGLKNNL